MDRIALVCRRTVHLCARQFGQSAIAVGILRARAHRLAITRTSGPERSGCVDGLWTMFRDYGIS
jgi:hypothetical protein